MEKQSNENQNSQKQDLQNGPINPEEKTRGIQQGQGIIGQNKVDPHDDVQQENFDPQNEYDPQAGKNQQDL